MKEKINDFVLKAAKRKLLLDEIPRHMDITGDNETLKKVMLAITFKKNGIDFYLYISKNKLKDGELKTITQGGTNIIETFEKLSKSNIREEHYNFITATMMMKDYNKYQQSDLSKSDKKRMIMLESFKDKIGCDNNDFKNLFVCALKSLL